MRDYVLSQAEILDRSGVFPQLRRILRNLRNRRRMREMLDLDDRLLKDAGVNRIDLEYVLALPLDVDPTRELERLSLISSPESARSLTLSARPREGRSRRPATAQSLSLAG